MTDGDKAAKFLETLVVSEGPRAGQTVKLAPFQRQFVKNALRKRTDTAILSVARGGGKSTLSAGLALGSLIGEWKPEPRRQIILAARSRDQAAICWNHARAFAAGLPEDIQARLTFRRAPRLEIELEADDGPHVLSAIAADARNALGMAPSLIVCDERAHWPDGRGDDLEQSLMTGLHKRGGRCIMISTSAPTDSHAFSRWIDNPPTGAHVAEYRPAPGLPPDDLDSLLLANPGARYGVGASVQALQEQAKRAIERGGHALTSFRLFVRNERVSAEARDVLVTLDEWLACETADPPPRQGEVIIGIDLGGSASMTAAAFFWPATGRLEVKGWFPTDPSLLARGQADGVNSRYCEMQDRGELAVLGNKTVPVAQWLAEVMQRVQGLQIGAVVADRYKQAELAEAMQAAGVRCPVIWRGMGFRDGSEDIERFRRQVYDGTVMIAPSLLMRSALSDAVCLRDPANNAKLAKARSLGRIDAAAATVLAVAEGARRRARPVVQARAPQWA